MSRAAGKKTNTESAPKRILVAEDSPVCRRLLESVLAEHPYELYVASNGQEALTGFKTFDPDIMLLDWIMPDLSGAELCRIIRKSQNTYIYIILITSSTERSRVIEGLDSGADDYQ